MRAAAAPDQPVGGRQLLRHRQEGRDPARQGRRRRRRGRRGDPPRVRPRDPLLAGLPVLDRGGRRDQRGLRRLLGRDGLGGRAARASALPASPDPACVADWDSTSYTRRCRTASGAWTTDKTYPDDLVGEVHADGEIWSQALWDIRTAIGNVEGRHGDPRGPVRLRRRHDAGARRGHRRRGEGAVRPGGRQPGRRPPSRPAGSSERPPRRGVAVSADATPRCFNSGRIGLAHALTPTHSPRGQAHGVRTGRLEWH